MYREPEIALSINSKYSEKILNQENVYVIRHPHFLLPFIWSHHEKLVIVD